MAKFPRSSWTRTAASAPDVLRPSRVDGLAVHWNGPKVPAAVADGRPESVAAFLEGVRRFHVFAHGWSDIAYQQAVDNRGNRWVLRGWRNQSAANGDLDANRRFGAVYCLIGQGQRPSVLMLDAVRDAFDEFGDDYPHARRLVTHNQVRPEPTACPGPDLTSWVKAGGPRPHKPEPPTPGRTVTIGEDERMTIIVAPNGSRFHLTSKGLLWLPSGVQVDGPAVVVHADDDAWSRYQAAYDHVKP